VGVAFTAKTVTKGAAVTFAGKVTAASSARTVKLQRYYSTAWHTVKTARTAKGAYSIKITMSAVRTDRYRVVVVATSRAATGVSRTTTVVTKAPPVIRGSAAAYRFLFPSKGRWNPCATIGYRVNTAYATAGALADTQAAIARVAATTGLRFAYRGTTRVMPNGRAEAYPADTQLMKYAAGFGAGPTSGWQGTRGQLLMHEIGHVVGLDHPSQKDPWEIMYPTLTRKPAVYGNGDRAGLKVLGSSNGCLYTTRGITSAALVPFGEQ
jgi:hypothetical protein